MPREHPLCQFGLLILFLQTFEESTPGFEPSRSTTFFVFLFFVWTEDLERSLIPASLIPWRIRRPAHVQVA